MPLIRVKSRLGTNLTITVFNQRLQNRFRNLVILQPFFNSWHWNKMEAISISVSGGTEEYGYMYCQVHVLKRDRKWQWRLGGRWLIVLTDTAQVVWSRVDTTSMVSLTNMAKLIKSLLELHVLELGAPISGSKRRRNNHFFRLFWIRIWICQECHFKSEYPKLNENMKAKKFRYEYKPLIKDIGFSKAMLNHDGRYLARDYPDVTPVTPQGVSQGCQQGRIILIDICHLD